MPHDCTHGHVTVEDDDPTCLECCRELQPGDRVRLRVTRHRRFLGEMVDPADRASVPEWGGARLSRNAHG